MGTKTTKSVFDAIGATFNALFSVNASNEYVQMTVTSDGDGNINSTAFPSFIKTTGVNFIEPASFQTSTNLGIGLNYATAIEDALSQPNMQILARGSHAYSVTITQYRDALGTKLMQTNVITRSAGVQVLENMQITGNYVQIVYLNTSGAVMTETMLYASLGNMPLTPDTLGQATSAKSFPVVLASEYVGQKASSASIPVVLSTDYSNTTQVVRNAMSITGNTARLALRSNQFGEWIVSMVWPQQFALENSYGVAPINPAIGTSIALGTAIQASYIGTAPSILVRNAATAWGKDVTIGAVELSLIGAGVGLTDLWIEVHVDTANRYSSGGSVIPGRTLYSQSATTAFTGYNASVAIVATADTTTYTRLFRRRVKTVAPVAGDIYKFIFDGSYDSGSFVINGTVPTIYNMQAPICVIPPVGTLLFYVYSTGMTTAPTFEGTIEFTER